MYLHQLGKFEKVSLSPKLLSKFYWYSVYHCDYLLPTGNLSKRKNQIGSIVASLLHCTLRLTCGRTPNTGGTKCEIWKKGDWHPGQGDTPRKKHQTGARRGTSRSASAFCAWRSKNPILPLPWKSERNATIFFISKWWAELNLLDDDINPLLKINEYK